jgi:hypothetical protein
MRWRHVCGESESGSQYTWGLLTGVNAAGSGLSRREWTGTMTQTAAITGAFSRFGRENKKPRR